MSLKLVFRDEMNIVIGQMSRFEPKLKNEDIYLSTNQEIMENQEFEI